MSSGVGGNTTPQWEADLLPALIAHLSNMPQRKDSTNALKQRFSMYRAQWQHKYRSFTAFVAAQSPVFIITADAVELNSAVSMRPGDAITTRASLSRMSLDPHGASPTQNPAAPILDATTTSSQKLHGGAGVSQLSTTADTRAQLFALRDRLKSDAPRQFSLPVTEAPLASTQRRAKSGPVDLNELREESHSSAAHDPTLPSERYHRRSASSDKDVEPPSNGGRGVSEDWEVELVGTLVEHLSASSRRSEDIHVLTAKFGHKHRVAIYHKYRKFRSFLQNFPETFDIDDRDQVLLVDSGSPRQLKRTPSGPITSRPSLTSLPLGSTSTSTWEDQLIVSLLKLLQQGPMEWTVLSSAFPQYRGHIKYSYGTFKSFLLHHPAVFRVHGESVSSISISAPIAPAAGAHVLDSAHLAPDPRLTTPRLSPVGMVPPLPIATAKKSPPVSSAPSPRASGPVGIPKTRTAPIAIPASKSSFSPSDQDDSGWIDPASHGSSFESDVDSSRTSDVDHDDLHIGDDTADDVEEEGIPIEANGISDASSSPNASTSVLSSTPTSSTTFGLGYPLDEGATQPEDAPPPAAPAYRPKFRPALRQPGSSSSSSKTTQFSLPSKPVMPSFTFFPRPETKVRSPIFSCFYLL
jgi:hypothetical protein